MSSLQTKGRRSREIVKIIVRMNHTFFLICTDGVIRRYVLEEEQGDILGTCHSSPYGGHHGGARIASKVLSCGFYWPTFTRMQAI